MTADAQVRPIRVLCVDDHPLICEGLGVLLNAQPDITKVADAATGRDGVEQYRSIRPDIVLMDLRLPDISGLEATEAIRDEFPEARVIVLTSYDGDQDIYRALELGVRGYLFKEIVHTDLIRAIRTVHAGRRYIPPQVSEQLIEYFPEIALTNRETEVLVNVANGFGNKEIGHRLGAASGTVKAHVQSILGKLGARDRTQAVTIALSRGILHLKHRSVIGDRAQPVQQ
jgi:DNA-binding NarL/FixJ family response regulator